MLFLPAWHRKKRRHLGPNAGRYLVDGVASINQLESLRLRGSKVMVGLAHAFMEFDVLQVEA